jgi:GTP1/Obg family GTP-binding protein
VCVFVINCVIIKKFPDSLFYNLQFLQTLRAMPVVDLETPTLCLVGAPNVGKSSLVRTLSTGKPEVLAD